MNWFNEGLKGAIVYSFSLRVQHVCGHRLWHLWHLGLWFYANRVRKICSDAWYFRETNDACMH